MKNEGIKHINYLEIHDYIPLKIKGILDFNEVCNKIKVSEISFNDNFRKFINDVFCSQVKDIVDEFNCNNKHKGYSMKLKDEIDFDLNMNSDIAQLLVSDISVSDNLSIEIRNDLLDEYEFRKNMIQNEFDFSKKFYGKLFVKCHDRFFLLPLKIKLDNNEEFWIIPQLLVFSNLISFIKYEIPMKNIDSEILKNNQHYHCIKEIKLVAGNEILKFSKLDEATNYFTDFLKKELRCKQIIKDKSFDNILLIDFDNIPYSLRSLKDRVKADIFYILSSPVPNRDIISYKEEINDFFATQSCGREDVMFFLRTNGGCMTLVSKNVLNGVLETDKDELSSQSKNFIYKKLAINVNRNCEFAIVLNMLEKMNKTLYFLDRFGKTNSSNTLDKEYNKNILFINLMIDSSYGSVFQQVKDFRKRMPLYHNDEGYNEKSEAINRILEQEKNDRELRFEKNISFLGIIFVVVFGLPTINESFKCIKSEFLSTIDVIPFFNLNQFSIIVWFFLIVFVCVFLFPKKEK